MSFARVRTVVVALAVIAGLGWAALNLPHLASTAGQLWERIATADERSLDRGGLDPELANRLARAQQAAASEGIALTVTSAYRSWDVQAQLYDEALARHGSEAEARRWALPPAESMHVRGLAIDVAVDDGGAAWLGRNGARFGLCRRYENEVWHFEMLTAPGGTCPALEMDASAGNPPR